MQKTILALSVMAATFVHMNHAHAMEPLEEGGRQYCSIDQVKRVDTANCFYQKNNIYHVPPWTTVILTLTGRHSDVAVFGGNTSVTTKARQELRNLTGSAVDINWSAPQQPYSGSGPYIESSYEAPNVVLRAESPTAVSR